MMIKILFGIFLVSHAVAPFSRANIQEAIYENQFAALASIYNATGMQFEGNHSRSWMNTGDQGSGKDYCQNDGVLCDRNGFVLAIDLRSQGLNGTIPNEIGSFLHLRALRLSDNELRGTLPSHLMNMTALRYLNLGRNHLSGIFPHFNAMSALHRLILGQNSFSGTIPNSICELSNLEALDISSCTKLYGTLPPCLEDLPALNYLKITDVGLTGTVPTGLCDGRSMNGLDPNPFGCDAIGCAAGSFHRDSGRQAEEGDPCSICQVPSNALSSSTCQWISKEGHGDDGVQVDGRTVQAIQTFWPSFTPSNSPSQYPTVHETTEFPLIQPTTVPSLRTMQSSQLSDGPTIVPTSETFVFAETLTPVGSASSEVPTVDIFLNASEAENNPSTGGLIGGSATAGACVLIFLLFILSRQGPPKYFIRADNEEDSERFVEEPTRGTVRIRRDPPILSSLRSPASLSTIDEEDSAQVSRSDSLESTFTLQHQQSLDIMKRPSPSDPPSPPDLRVSRGVKKVRFALPNDTILGGDLHGEAERNDIESARDTANFGNVDRWARWIMNPVFDTHNFCAPATNAPAEDERSWHSFDAASTNSDRPILSQTDSETSSSTVVSNMRVLGISSACQIRDDRPRAATRDPNQRPPSAKKHHKPKAGKTEESTRKATSSVKKPAKKPASSQDSRHIWRRNKGMVEI